jgi:hypothetical protein
VLAARQHGLVAISQIEPDVASPAVIRHRVARGRWAKVAEGVYRIAGAPVTWESQVLASVLAGGPKAVASHRTAGALWDLDGCRPGMPEVSVPRGRSYRTDLAYPEHRLAIELDDGDHLRREQWEADHARQNAVVPTAWTILRHTWRDDTLDATRIVTEVRRALQQAADR